MAKDQDKAQSAPRRPAHKITNTERLQDIFKVDKQKRELEKINEIGKLLWVHPDASEEAVHSRILRALELYEGLEPMDAAEGMLAMQMVGTHDAALECLKRAALDNQTFEGRDMALKHAQKLMSLYMQQLAALNKHRGKGQQKVTVEHVNVQAGGQAIVGNVEQGQSKSSQTTEPPALEHTPESPVHVEESYKQRVKKRSG